MASPRVVATDLDGTLLRSDSSLSDRTRAALRAARAAGIRVVVATARPARVVDRIFGGEDLVDAAICGNGAVRYDLAARSLLVTHPLGIQVAGQVIAEVARVVPQVAFAAETGHRVLQEIAYTYRPTFDEERFTVRTRDELVAEPLVKLMALVPQRDPALAWGVLRPSLCELVTCTWSTGYGAGDHAYPAILELGALGVSKAAALADLCAQWSITPGEVAAFGDAPNDLDMLAWAGTGYAVANAHPDVVTVATQRVPSNDEDGVAQLLEELLR